MVTVEFNNECTSATITIPNEISTYKLEAIDKRTNEAIYFESDYKNEAYTIKVDFSRQTILAVTLIEEIVDEETLEVKEDIIVTYAVLLNCNSLKCLVSSNKNDVVKQLKSCNIGIETDLLSATNRVVIANSKLKYYNLGIEGLDYLESMCDNEDCETC